MKDVKVWTATRRDWVRLIQRVFMCLALMAIVAYGLANRETVASTMSRLQLWAVLRTGAIMLVLHVLIVSSFQWLHVALGIRRPWRRAVASYFARLPGRFLPGGIWHSMLRYGDMHSDQSASARTLGIVLLSETALLAGTGFLAAGGLGFALLGDSPRVMTIARIMLLVGFVPSVVLGTLCWRRSGQQALRPFVVAFLLMVTTWLGLAFAFASFSTFGSRPMLAGCSAGPVAASYLASASVGYVAVFAPQGWGVTELVFAKLSACTLPTASLVTTVVAFRIVSLAADAVAFTIAMLLRVINHWIEQWT